MKIQSTKDRSFNDLRTIDLKFGYTYTYILLNNNFKEKV